MERSVHSGLFAALVVCIVALSGCATRAPLVTYPSPAPPAASAQGVYRAGTRFVLEDGASFQVPAGCEARLRTNGGLLTTPTLDSGGTMESRRWGHVEFSVYGPQAGFAPRQALMQKYADRSRVFPAREDGDITVARSRMTLGVEASGTAYVVTYFGKRPAREIHIFIERRSAKPLMISSLGPPALRAVSDAVLPVRLLDYLGFRLP